MTSYTPKPWCITGRTLNNNEPIVGNERGTVAVVTVRQHCEPGGVTISTKATKKETNANAQLIVASPRLFEALRGILEIGKRNMTNPKYDTYFNEAREALAEASEEK